ncbi:hypothetical protein GMST_05350 [Geomonas silvestris]|uniref:Uncharacterized protein n=1 Tax=Geomonas silvestris TaxID=2740184 RepID=A0A6V8ME00_9BACT|nr:hypothetical protein [Geomonas silvestris]GFO58210.1 hypothetical protein GMST_05350 [Geomonas silvestris]
MASELHENKKYPCPDCTFCQWCSDDRCRKCRSGAKCPRKLSQAEQIELYEKLNQPQKPKE